MDTTQFLDYLTRSDATQPLGDAFTELVFARRASAARRALLSDADVETDRRVSIAS